MSNQGAGKTVVGCGLALVGGVLGTLVGAVASLGLPVGALLAGTIGLATGVLLGFLVNGVLVWRARQRRRRLRRAAASRG